MSKLTYFFVIFAIAMCINADDNIDDENATPDDDGNQGFPFPIFPNGFPGMPPMGQFPPMKPLGPDDIANLNPSDDNTKVSGSSVSSYSALSTINGVPVNKVETARIVTNDNGNVTDTTYSN